MKYLKHKIISIASLIALMAPSLSSCSDEPDSENFYTFTGEMASDYLKSREQYSEFAEIVDRAGLMDLLATYGHYTCFVPDNNAVNTYLKSRGMNSVSDLTTADCDTLARTHLVSNMYTTAEMSQDRLPTSNLLGRYIATSSGMDEKENAVIFLEGLSHIYFETQDDSVENGIMQPIDRVIEKSNNYISDLLRDNPKISTFYGALVATDVISEIMKVEDETYHNTDYPRYYYRSHIWSEVAWVPDTKKYGYTAFVEPDSVYNAKFQEYGISTANGTLNALYDLACKIYDPVYPEDVGKPGHSFENLHDSINPLHRFVQYHFLTRYTAGASDLTPMDVNIGVVKGAFGFEETLINPIDWFHTLLPHTMIKVEKLTVAKYMGNGIKGERYVNRRYDDNYQFEGARVDPTVESDVIHDGLNGHYYYVDDLIAFSSDVQNKIQNMRIRMDFSSVFPEVMTNGLRFEGNPEQDDDAGRPDDSATPKNGRNYYFPLGYLDGVSFSNCSVVLRRPHINFWSWQGDEWNLFGDYDFTFRLPPIPYSGDWQVRLGFCAIETRGVMQVYFDGIPQGIPLDMTKYLNSDLYIGDRFVSDEGPSDYDNMSPEEKAEEQKLMKNLGAYRAPRSLFHFSPSNKNYFVGNERTYRRILCQTYMDATKDHYIRFRVASDGKQGNNNEFMLDYLELVPKSVYGVDSEGEMEDDL
ncbi:MAG: fasciclin domain-containing protein [Prevotella sp.]|nr:fasciclin domain-containing protein [Prevotella sp.]